MTSDRIIKALGDKWIRLVVLLLVLAVLAYQISVAFWNLVPIEGQLQSSITPVPVVEPTDANGNGTDYKQQANIITRSNLFGKAEVKAAPKPEPKDAPETKLNYKLRGIYFSTDARLSSAIVEVKPNKSQHYLVDDELDDNIFLTGIEADHILISRYGKIERLNLEKRGDGKGQSFVSADEEATSAQTALLQNYKKRYSRNPMALATRFQAIPVQQDGKNIGFKLKPLRGESLLQKLEFEPDDVFTAVNGVSLSNPFEALDALKSLTTAESLSVTFMRNGSEQTLDFQI